MGIADELPAFLAVRLVLTGRATGRKVFQKDFFLQRSQSQTVLLGAGFGGLLFVLTYLVLGALAPGYDSARDTISALEFTSYALVQRVNFVLFGMSLGVFAVALRRELGTGRGSVVIPIVQCCSGIGVAGGGFFIHEPMHMVSDLIAFNSAIVVVALFAWRFYGDTRWKGWVAYSIVTALLMMSLLTAFGVAQHIGGPAGVFEKLASLMRSSWSALLVRQFYLGRTLEGS
jgi:Protein of unknown function (DUF998)